MPYHVKDLRDNLLKIANDYTSLDILLGFEGVLDNVDIYAYKNWFNGEIVEGPKVGRYWVTVKLMFPAKMMPDPKGGMRLVDYGCEVSFKEGTFRRPVRVSGPEDYEDRYTKKAKIKNHEVWFVEIKMPRRFIDDGLLSSYEDRNTINVDHEDVANSYDESFETENEDIDDMDIGSDDFFGDEEFE